MANTVGQEVHSYLWKKDEERRRGKDEERTRKRKDENEKEDEKDEKEDERGCVCKAPFYMRHECT